MIDQLSREERLQLLRFVCSFAWADLEVRDQEKSVVHKLVKSFELDEEEAEEVEALLRSPPDPEDIDPQDIPIEHREIFLEAVKAMIYSDGEISPVEAESFELLDQLIR
ncbi:MAG: TerB family tellurite resistance protein [Alphaproteobacteria bacterium]|nr:TerB family tellurite resistance protein [Alphaproteobacteria bacterium]